MASNLISSCRRLITAIWQKNSSPWFCFCSGVPLAFTSGHDCSGFAQVCYITMLASWVWLIREPLVGRPLPTAWPDPALLPCDPIRSTRKALLFVLPFFLHHYHLVCLRGQALSQGSLALALISITDPASLLRPRLLVPRPLFGPLTGVLFAADPAAPGSTPESYWLSSDAAVPVLPQLWL